MSLILGRLGVSRKAHVFSILGFALSKIHLTLIGYIAVYYALIGLFLLLSTLLFFLRFMESRRVLDYVLSVGSFGLLIHVRDSHFVGLGVVATLGWVYGVRFRRELKRDAASVDGPEHDAWRRGATYSQWILYLVPFTLLVIAYGVLRYMVVGPPPPNHPTYTPRLSLKEIVVKASFLVAAGANVSWTDDGAMGAPGLGRWLAFRLSSETVPVAFGDILLGGAWGGLCAALIVSALRRGAGRSLLFPLSWVVLYFLPTVLTQNRQIYYMQESLAGLAVLLAIGLDHAGPYLRRLWGGALVVTAVNGLVSNYTSSYHWQFAARQVERAYQAVRASYTDRPPRSVTLATRSKSFWYWALLAGPVLPYVLHQDDLVVRVVDYSRLGRLLQVRRHWPNAQDLCIDVDNGWIPCRSPGFSKPLVLRALVPAQTEVGQGFNVQPDGRSAIAVTAENATPGTVIVMAEQTLPTTYGNPTWLTALVPPEFLNRPGTYPVYLTDGLRTSNRLDFIVRPRASIPVLVRLYPTGTRVGQGFNVQSDGQSALAVQAKDATPDTVVVWETRPLTTTYGGPTLLTALVPAELYSRPGRYSVYLRNHGGESNRLEFVVVP
ncbi:MAG: hypothetical protein NZ742_08805 [Acidobacteria bacterium]|nr:hypothetical protein [Acidobacteriota bacterium]MDW7984923.1 hypothetical protein [Acidobacteriota bacterium]